MAAIKITRPKSQLKNFFVDCTNALGLLYWSDRPVVNQLLFFHTCWSEQSNTNRATNEFITILCVFLHEEMLISGRGENGGSNVLIEICLRIISHHYLGLEITPLSTLYTHENICPNL